MEHEPSVYQVVEFSGREFPFSIGSETHDLAGLQQVTKNLCG